MAKRCQHELPATSMEMRGIPPYSPDLKLGVAARNGSSRIMLSLGLGWLVESILFSICIYIYIYKYQTIAAGLPFHCKKVCNLWECRTTPRFTT